MAEKKPKKTKEEVAEDAAAAKVTAKAKKAAAAPAPPARLRAVYLKEIVPALSKEFGYTNSMRVPKLEKISINIGVGEATQNAKLADVAANDLATIAGQK